jgi:hypothetical protein
MSSVIISGDTSGAITVSAPAVAGTTTLTLPATTGTVIASDASANIQFNSGFGSVATAYGCRAWVNFNGTGTVAIRASGNVTSITDNGTGDYTVNFTTAMPDANYGFSIGAGEGAGTPNSFIGRVGGINPTTTLIRIKTGDSASLLDPAFCSVSIFR